MVSLSTRWTLYENIVFGKVIDLMGDICLSTLAKVKKKNTSLVKTEKTEEDLATTKYFEAAENELDENCDKQNRYC
jgi:hypothetical protein